METMFFSALLSKTHIVSALSASVTSCNTLFWGALAVSNPNYVVLIQL